MQTDIKKAPRSINAKGLFCLNQNLQNLRIYRIIIKIIDGSFDFNPENPGNPENPDSDN